MPLCPVGRTGFSGSSASGDGRARCSCGSTACCTTTGRRTPERSPRSRLRLGHSLKRRVTMSAVASSVARTFEDRPAVRTATPLLFGLIGPSGSGKTFSALRIASGMQRVIGGDIFLIDTESSRALHYAEKFRFRHVAFTPPFSPLDYLGAIEHCVSKGAKIVIIDSMSHEHEGPGGVLEWHEQEVERLMQLWRTSSAEKVNIPAWGK